VHAGISRVALYRHSGVTQRVSRMTDCPQGGTIVSSTSSFVDFATNLEKGLHDGPVFCTDEAWVAELARLTSTLPSAEPKPFCCFDRFALAVGLPCVRDDEGLWLEFGVSSGTTMRIISSYRAHRRSAPPPVYGFDWFQGLPSSSGIWNKGSYAMAGQEPPFASSSVVQWEVGLFNETLPPFLHRHKHERISFLHIDCDLYVSTKVVFDALRHRISDGLVIVFDELWKYPAWREHEAKALYELLQDLRRAYDVQILGVGSRVLPALKASTDRKFAAAVRLVKAAA